MGILEHSISQVKIPRPDSGAKPHWRHRTRCLPSSSSSAALHCTAPHRTHPGHSLRAYLIRAAEMGYYALHAQEWFTATVDLFTW